MDLSELGLAHQTTIWFGFTTFGPTMILSFFYHNDTLRSTLMKQYKEKIEKYISILTEFITKQ